MINFDNIFKAPSRKYSCKGQARICDAKEFAVDFANTLTVVSTKNSDAIAKRGRESLFGVLQKVFPQVFVQAIFFEHHQVHALTNILLTGVPA